MANRFPLVFDAGAAKSIQELPTGDNLNLSGSSIANAVNISATGTLTVPTLNVTSINVNGSAIAAVASTNDYNDLTNKPSLFSGDYNDLTNKPADGVVSWNTLADKPVIASKISQLTNDTNFVSNAQVTITSNQVTDLATVATSGSFNDLANVPNFVTNEQIVGGTLTVEVSNTGDLQGSVFADDSSLMVDHINNELITNKLKTDVIESDNFALLAQRNIVIDTSEFVSIKSQSFELYNDNSGTNISDLDVLRFQGNVDFTQASVSGLTLGDVVGDLKGSVFSDDSAVMVDAVNNIITANTVNGDSITGTNIYGNLSKQFDKLTISSTAGIDILPAGALNIPNATSVIVSATNGISLAATDNLVLSSSSGIIDFASGSTVDFTDTIVTGLNVQATGDLVGSVFADNSTLLVDGVNGKVVGDIESTSLSVTSNTGYGITVSDTQASVLVLGQDGLTVTNASGSVLGGTSGVTLVGAAGGIITIGAGTAGNIILGSGSNTVQLVTSTSLDISDLTLINFANSTISGLAGGSVSYTATTPANWFGTPPATVQEAIDRIAAALQANAILA
tara:strand:+ start:544 stop:2241 length:1698 start_codon:yes stop_codon:yes gene_type:complete